MIGDFFLRIINAFLGFMIGLLPVNLPFISIVDFKNFLLGFERFIENALWFVSPFFPSQFLLNALLFALSLIIIVFLFKITKALVNFLRGSGA